MSSLLTQVSITVDRRELGDYFRASTEHDEIVAKCRALLGPLHYHTLRTIRLQAGMRRKASDHEGAIQLADEAYEGLRSRYGDDHPETIAAALCRSINFRSSNSLDEATFRDRLGEDHPSTITMAINLASDLFALGEVTAAHELDVATTERAERLWGADHLTTLAVKANLAQDLRALGREDESNALRTEVVSKTSARLGTAHPAVREFANPDLRANCDIDPMPL